MRRRRRSTMSASAPAGSARTNIGTDVATCTREQEGSGQPCHQPASGVLHPNADVGHHGCYPQHREGGVPKWFQRRPRLPFYRFAGRRRFRAGHRNSPGSVALHLPSAWPSGSQSFCAVQYPGILHSLFGLSSTPAITLHQLPEPAACLSWTVMDAQPNRALPYLSTSLVRVAHNSIGYINNCNSIASATLCSDSNSRLRSLTARCRCHRARR